MFEFIADHALVMMIVILVVTTIAGMPLGISMIVSSIFYLVLAGRDVGLAAENVLNGVFGNFVALAVPNCVSTLLAIPYTRSAFP